MKQIDLDGLLQKIEVKYVIKALKTSNGNIQKASDLIGVNRTTLLMRLKRLNIEVDREKNKYSKAINIQTEKTLDISNFGERELNAYKKFSALSKEQKVDLVIPFNDVPIDEISFSKLERRFGALINGEYKNALMRKLMV